MAITPINTGALENWLGSKLAPRQVGPKSSNTGTMEFWLGARQAPRFFTTSLLQTISPSGIASAEAFGTDTINQNMTLTAIASAEAFGTASVNLAINPSAIVSAEAFGTATLNRNILLTGIVSAEAFGTPTITSPILLTGIVSAEAFGTAVVSLRSLSVVGIASAEAFGSLTIVNAAIVIVATPFIVDGARAWVILYDTNGQKVAVFDDWITLEIKHTLNSFSTAVLELDGNDPRLSYFLLDTILEVWRRAGDYVYLEYIGFHRTAERQLSTEQQYTFISNSVGLLHLVRRRVVAYVAVTAFTLKQAPAETVMKQIVNENLGPGAISPPRFVAGVMPGFSIAADGALGPVYTAQLDTSNVLDVLNNISTAIIDTTTLNTVDFDVIRTGPITFEFRTYWPQRGVDRTASLAFSPELGNMSGPVYRIDRTDEVNQMIVLGPGQGSSQWILPVAGTGQTDSPWNTLEATTNGSGSSTTDSYDSLLSAGQTALNESMPKETFTFDVVQEDIALYGRDYTVGDRVTARLADISRVVKIVGATLTIREGEETIGLDFSELPG